MRDSVLWRKTARIIMELASVLAISEERALDLFYSTKTYRQLCRGPEREVDVAREDLGDIRARDVHAPGELGLRHPKLLHPPQYPPQKRRPNFINRLHA